MIRDKYNIIPNFMAALVHLVVFGSLFLVLDLSSPTRAAMPLVLEATLVTEDEIPPPPPPVEEEPEPEPEPDNSEAERLRQEEEKRLADQRVEQERIRLQQEEDRQRRDQEKAERKKREEDELERRRAEAERKRQEDLERQRRENEQQRREAEEAEIRRRQQQEIDAEENRLLAMQADDLTRWVFALQEAIWRNFVPPASTPIDLECIVDVRQLPGGTVVNVEVGRCNGDDAVRRAIEAALFKASPLPEPENPRIFERDLRITFKPEQ